MGALGLTLLTWAFVAAVGYFAYSGPGDFRLPIAIAAGGCAFWSVGQLRMMLVYLGVGQSQNIVRTPALAPVALRSAVKFSLFTLILILFRWPVIVTYVLAVQFLLSLYEFLRLSRSPHFEDEADAALFATARANRPYWRNAIIMYGVGLAAAGYCIGFM